ncbi:MAG: hypothetical protein Q8O99_05840 [bacterium]|nr:hypothetical protein [bacterium]
MTYAKQHYKQSIQDKIISPGIYTQAQIDEMSDFKLRNMLSLYL